MLGSQQPWQAVQGRPQRMLTPGKARVPGHPWGSAESALAGTPPH